ncbi:HAD family hydrolase [Actinomadura scrupuli]|uniref:HAD family hydrolase n=1 Tax=Actinomadura scrupuli TaxID=559629 RepID=UPI003D993419
MTTLVCVDLDRTLIYSRAAMDGGGPAPQEPPLRCVELYQELPLSYVTQVAAERLERLGGAALLVPTTTRTPEQYARVRLPGGPPRYAICANGGRLLVDGVEDEDWSARVRARTDGCASPGEVFGHLAEVSGDYASRPRIASELFCYLVIDRAAPPAAWIAGLTAWCAELGWTTSVQGRKIYCLPRALTKSAAAVEVARRSGAGALLAAGDSLLDGELLEAADAAIRPAHGELAEAGGLSARIQVTAARGVAAGEEIAGWLLDRALDPTLIPATGPWRTLPPDPLPVPVRGI